MPANYNLRRRNGHYGGHVRDMFLEAVEVFHDWEDGKPEPTVNFEVHYEPRQITISKACGLLWNCSDILPRQAVDTLEWCGIYLDRRTYASAARAMLERIRQHMTVGSRLQETTTPYSPQTP
jgi:hypothetical protein